MSKHRSKGGIEVREGQACVVMDKAYWDHIISVYTIMANDCHDLDEKANWLHIIDTVKAWVESTFVDPLEVIEQLKDSYYERN